MNFRKLFTFACVLKWSKLTNVKKVLFFLILTSIIIGSCCQDDTQHFIPDRKKLKFAKNDIFVYTSSLGNIDTFTVTDVLDENITINEIEKFNCIYSEYYEKLTITLQKNGTTNGGTFIQKNYPTYDLAITNWLGLNASDKLLRYFIGDYKAGEINYTNVMRFENASGTSSILRLYYNEENGVVSYELNTDEIFNLTSYISAK